MSTYSKPVFFNTTFFMCVESVLSDRWEWDPAHPVSCVMLCVTVSCDPPVCRLLLLP